MGKQAPPSQLSEYLLTTEELAKRWGMSRSSIERLRFDGEGPPPVRLSDRTIRYKRSTVEQYEREREGF